ncbi:MAG: hypothetical protein IT436_06090 [Phycisphaerales bacterium]|nr:hypothetical protein [Phycisphaerales bacterium]
MRISRAIPAILILLGLVGLTLIPGCGDPQQVRLQRLAAAAKANRATAGPMIAAAYAKDGDTIDLLMAMAADQMEKGQDATALAGAVLDATQLLGKQLPQGEEFLIFWTRIGRLAFQSALFAYQKGDIEGARDLVLAGAPRWQTEQYWLRYTDHDALASIILYQTGQQQEAVMRLRARPVLTGDAEETLKKLTGGSE